MSIPPPPLPSTPPPVPDCPVCGAPARPGDAHCGWQTLGPLTAGPATPDARASLAARLGAARRIRRLTAALRVLESCAPANRPDWLTRLVAEAEPAEASAAEDAVRRAPSPPYAEYPDGLVTLLGSLTDGRLRRLRVLALGPEGLTGFEVTAGSGRVPLVVEAHRADWPRLLPALPADPSRALFALAGGGPEDAAPPPAAVPAALPDWCAPAADDEAVVLLDRCTDWPGTSHLRSALDQRCRPAVTVRAPMSPTPMTQVVNEMFRSAPLRHPVALAVTEREPVTQGYVTSSLPLFTAGTHPGRGCTGRVRVRTPASGSASGRISLTIAVVALTGTRPHEWTLLRSVEADLPEDTEVVVDVTLAAADDVRITLDGHPEPVPLPAAWPDLLARVSRAGRELPLDLVLLLELGGAESDRRVRMASRVVERIAAARPPGALRVRTVPYWEHRQDRATGQLAATHEVWPFVPPEVALDELESLYRHSEPVQEAFAAALEEPLAELAALGDWADGDRCLLVVATRPPQLGPDDELETVSRRCPRDRNWRDGLTATADWLGATAVLVPAGGWGDGFEARRAARFTEELWRTSREHGWHVLVAPGDGDTDDPGVAEKAAVLTAPEAATASPVPFPFAVPPASASAASSI
ncbi:hypothetical protein [Streptomyces sp. SD15]